MATKNVGRPKATPLDEARIALIIAGNRRSGRLMLSLEAYDSYRMRGMSPSTLDRLINLMAARDEVVLEHDGRDIWVRFLGPKE
jgi:hypothetical protein